MFQFSIIGRKLWFCVWFFSHHRFSICYLSISVCIREIFFSRLKNKKLYFFQDQLVWQISAKESLRTKCYLLEIVQSWRIRERQSLFSLEILLPDIKTVQGLFFFILSISPSSSNFSWWLNYLKNLLHFRHSANDLVISGLILFLLTRYNLSGGTTCLFQNSSWVALAALSCVIVRIIGVVAWPECWVPDWVV